MLIEAMLTDDGEHREPDLRLVASAPGTRALAVGKSSE